MKFSGGVAEGADMYRDVSSCNTYNYGDAVYWDARYLQEAGSFDWYQRYAALRPFVRKFISTSASVLMVGCGNAGNFPLFHLSAFFQFRFLLRFELFSRKRWKLELE